MLKVAIINESGYLPAVGQIILMQPHVDTCSPGFYC